LRSIRAAALLAATLLAACTSASPTGSGSPSASGSGATEPDQILRLSYVELGSLDPAAGDAGSLQLLVRGLTGLDEEMRTVPAIAESWEVTDQGRTITFHLRDATYSNGEPIVAGDFVYGWRRLLDPRVEGGYGFLLADLTGAADLLALQPDALPPDDVIDAMLESLGVTAVDERTLVAELARPAAFFATTVSNPVTAPIPESWITRPGATEANAFVSSGPFILTEWVHGQHREFEPNPAWWGEPPRLKRIEMQAFDSADAARAAFARGDIDVLGVVALPPEEALALAARPRPGSSFWFIGFDMLHPGSPTAASAELRRALSLAVDREELNATVGFSGPTAGSPIPPGVPGHDPTLESVFDPDAARESLARALDELGLTSPDDLELTFLHGTLVGNGPQYLDQQWREELGVEVEFVGLEPDQYFERLDAGHDFDMFWLLWFSDFPHPQSYLEPLWACQAPYNNAGFCNPAFDELLDQAASTGDEDAQLMKYAEAQRLLVEDAAAMFLQWPGGYALVAPWVEGLLLSPMDDFPGSLFVDRVSISSRN
jgi:ABC-type transport system substrate-binding protein